jgi:hypothetical protein
MAPLGFLALTFSRSMAPLGCLALTFSAPSGHELEGWPQRETVRSFSWGRCGSNFNVGTTQHETARDLLYAGALAAGSFIRNRLVQPKSSVRLSPTPGPLVLGKARSTATAVRHNLFCQVLEAALVP